MAAQPSDGIRSAAASSSTRRRSVEAGDVRPVIGAVFPMGDVPEAHRRLEAGGVRGKFVIDVREV
ncbi:zinc-binding dehydrogenase [Streptomyces sp. Agncl-13]|uniref:zinc-binding dehydrogenase n=1 Tax=Streptomyces sp. Agncl-13 TaxID=3400628 RepID=UPI003A870DE2